MCPRTLTVRPGHIYTCRMHPLVSIALVLVTALLWAAFTVLMLTSVNRTGRRALGQERNALRMRTRPTVHRDITAGTGPGRWHHLTVRRHRTSSKSLPTHIGPV